MSAKVYFPLQCESIRHVRGVRGVLRDNAQYCMFPFLMFANQYKESGITVANHRHEAFMEDGCL